MKPRLAVAEDVPEIVRVTNLAYRVEDFFVKGDRTSLEDVTTRMSPPDSFFFVTDAAEAGRLAGAVFVRVTGDRGYFGMLAVDPAEQGRGLGRVLVRAVEEYCAGRGCSALDLDVVDLREELPPFYESLGFVRGDVVPFDKPHKLKRDARMIVMSKALRTE